MPLTNVLQYFEDQIAELRDASLFKVERLITSRQSSHVAVAGITGTVINLCSNNYLGLCSDPLILAVAQEAVARFGYGLSSVRFICGTQDVHKTLEERLSSFLSTEDTILYSSCFDANTGLFETLFDERDAIISDELNHASIIDGIRLSKAKRYRYRNNDMADLERQLEAAVAADARFKVIATDGVFSMDGVVANLPGICDLAGQFDALVMVDDSHAAGFFGPNGRGTPEHFGVQNRVDLVTGTLGKALGGASGGYTAGRRPLISWLRQRSRPYLFSNTLAPMIAATSIAILDLIENDSSYRERLWANTAYFRRRLSEAGFELGGGGAPIIPVMLGDPGTASNMAEALIDAGLYVVAFSYPVVPHGKARIRTQLSATHTSTDLDRAADAFFTVGRRMGIIS
jgi:glycine C-acetyltransferase